MCDSDLRTIARLNCVAGGLVFFTLAHDAALRVVDSGSGAMVQIIHTKTGQVMNPIFTSDVQPWTTTEDGMECHVFIHSDSYASKVFAVMCL